MMLFKVAVISLEALKTVLRQKEERRRAMLQGRLALHAQEGTNGRPEFQSLHMPGSSETTENASAYAVLR